MKTGEILQLLRSKRGWSQPKLAELLHVSQSTITMWENNKRGINSESLLKIADLFNVSVDYLLGKETASTESAPVTNLVLTDERIPVYGKIHAGEPTYASQHIIGYTPATSKIIDQYGQASLFALQIEGDSMSRSMPDGFTAVFSKDAPIENGDIVAVLIDHEDATIKRFKETSMAVIFEPNSYNPIYKPIVFQKSGEQDFKILGKYIYSTSMPI